MAVKKTQMYRRNLDGTETDLNPLTESQYVLMENGQTVQEVLSDRDSDKYTPVITNSSSTFKVGQGDNADLSPSMKEGTYDSCVLKGKTMVNCIQEPNSKDVVLPYEFADGQYVTINDTKESGALGVELKGQTLVNEALIEYMNCANYASINGEKLTLDLSRQYSLIEISKRNPLVVPNQTYTCILYDVVGDTTNVNFSIQNGSSTKLHLKDVGYKFKFTMGIGNDLTDRLCYVENLVATSGTVSFKMVLLKGDYTDQDIPYFTGMTSCKMPILHTVGKNLAKFTTDQKEVLLDSTVETTRTLTLDVDELLTIVNKNVGKRICLAYEVETSEETTYGHHSIDLRPEFEDGTAVWWSTTPKRNGTVYKSHMIAQKVKQFLNKEVFFRSAKGTGRIYNVRIWISDTDTDTTYEPHKSSILSLPEEVVLRSLPNGVCDTFNTRTGVYTQRIKEVSTNDVINNTTWSKADGLLTSNNIAFYYKENNIKTVSGGSDGFGVVIADGLSCTNRDSLMQDIEGLASSNKNIIFKILKSKLPSSLTVNDFKAWLRANPMTIQYELATPIITKINLSSTLKSWNTTTHIYSEIPENSLYPILSHSNPTYPVILKPSTKYSIVANSYSNNHTNSTINFNLGGATASTTVGNRVTTITTPSTLSNELLTMSGRGNKLNNVMVIEGDVIGDEPYFEGICDSKSPILSNVGKNLLDIKNATRRGSTKCNFINHLDGSVTLVGDGDGSGEGILTTTCYAHLKQGETYTFSFESDGQYSGINGSDTVEAFLLKDGSASIRVIRMNDFTTTFTCQDDGDYYVRFDVNKNNTTHKFWNIQLTEGATVYPYEPYKSNTTTFNQKDNKTIVLRSLPNGICDTLNVETGEYVQRIGEVVLDGSDVSYISLSEENNYRTSTSCSVLTAKNSAYKPTNSFHCDALPTYHYNLALWNVKNKEYGISRVSEAWGFCVRLPHTLTGVTMSDDGSTIKQKFKEYLHSNPVIVQCELTTPIVTTIDVQGFPYAYTNGHVQLSSGAIEQSLTPKVEYSLSANKTGQINSNTKRVSAHQKQLDDFEAMMLTQMVQSAYDKAILQFDYEMQMMSLGGE